MGATLETIAGQNRQIIKSLGVMEEKVDNIDRGMYGDKVNKQPGLLDRQELDEKRLSKIESKQVRQAIILGLLLGVGTFLMNGGLEILNNIFGK